MKYPMTKIWCVLAVALVATAAGSQSPFDAIGNAIGGLGGGVVSKTGVVAEKLITGSESTQTGPLNEYLVGYRVAARILGSSPPLPLDHPVSQYIDRIGQTVALGSDYPYPYRGYYFIVLETPDINAFAAPGGFVFITTGMIKFLRNEEELATILGHEIGHIELNHGMQALRQGSQTKAIGGALQELASENLIDEVQPAVELLSDEIYKSVQNGYSSELEAEADARSAEICASLGYDASAMLSVLERFKTYKGNYGGAGYPEERTGLYAGKLQQAGYAPPSPVSARLDRFADAQMRTP